VQARTHNSGNNGAPFVDMALSKLRRETVVVAQSAFGGLRGYARRYAQCPMLNYQFETSEEYDLGAGSCCANDFLGS